MLEGVGLEAFFDVVGEGQQDLTLGEWTLFCRRRAFLLYMQMRERGQERVLPIATRSVGCGHHEMCVYDPTTSAAPRLFFVSDGGATREERRANVEHRAAMDAEDIDAQPTVALENWLAQVKKDAGCNEEEWELVFATDVMNKSQ